MLRYHESQFYWYNEQISVFIFSASIALIFLLAIFFIFKKVQEDFNEFTPYFFLISFVVLSLALVAISVQLTFLITSSMMILTQVFTAKTIRKRIIFYLISLLLLTISLSLDSYRYLAIDAAVELSNYISIFALLILLTPYYLAYQFLVSQSEFEKKYIIYLMSFLFISTAYSLTQIFTSDFNNKNTKTAVNLLYKWKNTKKNTTSSELIFEKRFKEEILASNNFEYRSLRNSEKYEIVDGTDFLNEPLYKVSKSIIKSDTDSSQIVIRCNIDFPVEVKQLYFEFYSMTNDSTYERYLKSKTYYNFSKSYKDSTIVKVENNKTLAVYIYGKSREDALKLNLNSKERVLKTKIEYHNDLIL